MIRTQKFDAKKQEVGSRAPPLPFSPKLTTQIHLTLERVTISLLSFSIFFVQIAIPDQCNSFKKDSEQMFHTRFKGFVTLHPTSVFSRSPNLLRPPDIHVENKYEPSFAFDKLSCLLGIFVSF